ncbi:MbtH family protein [Streptomyces sp. DT2A-34]|uniref:MbtH family protein n=1 Tax=Streptomyces sp. DT2A-34 TaxID=3051182 RepID=UPI0034638738
MDRFVVVVNAEGHHSLWAADEPLPGGWRTVHGPDSRQGALAYVEAEWKDQTPASVRAWLGASSTLPLEGHRRAN